MRTLFDDLSRRDVLARGAGALVAAALPLARSAPAAGLAPPAPDATLQAYYDTIIPGRRVTRTATGLAIHPRAIAGVDPEPGAVEADALALGRHRKIGFDALAPAFLADLERRALAHGAPFLALDYAHRERVCISGLSFDNRLRVIWEAGAAVAFTAFCGAGLAPAQTAAAAPGYAVMGLPGEAPGGYPDASYGLALATERTATGNLD